MILLILFLKVLMSENLYRFIWRIKLNRIMYSKLYFLLILLNQNIIDYLENVGDEFKQYLPVTVTVSISM